MPKWVETADGYFEPVYTREDIERFAPRWRETLNRATGESEPEPDEGTSER